MTVLEFTQSSGSAIPAEYLLRETSLHTDIESGIVPSDFAAFGRVDVATTQPSPITGPEWLKCAMCRFDLTFGSSRNSATLQFFSNADALSYRLRWHELATASTAAVAAVYALRNPKNEEVTDSSDQIVLPRQLCTWLDISYEQLAGITGVSRASFFNWRQPGARPRPSNMQRIQRLHALVSLLVRRFGIRGARVWLNSGEQPVWDLLIAGDLIAVEQNVRSNLFRQSAPDNKHNELPLGEVDLDLPAAGRSSTRVPRRAARQPTRRRLEAS